MVVHLGGLMGPSQSLIQVSWVDEVTKLVMHLKTLHITGYVAYAPVIHW